MNNPNNIDVDPLSTYEYRSYENYAPPTSVSSVPVNYDPPYSENLKYGPPTLNPVHPNPPEPIENNLQPAESSQASNQMLENLVNIKNEDERHTDSKKGIIKEEEKIRNIHIKIENVTPKARKKPKKDRHNGEKSTYLSQKINVGYPFYGCALCNVNYPTLHELDTHVTTHKNRFTSYDLRIKNQIRRKKLRKEQKKLKKLGVVVKQEPDIEIKPEDGYIGMETATNFMTNNSIPENSQTSTENSQASSENGRAGSDLKSAIEIKRMIENEQQNLTNVQKIYKCFACHKQFTLSYYLKLHVRSHTDEKPYKCRECDLSFITASKLGRHIKRIHLAIKYTCRICYKVFTRFEYLTRHFDKKHPEDKLEGEPYDYNAILPYLKELEDQLKLKCDDTKPKTEGLWADYWHDLTANQPIMAANQSDVASNQSVTDSNQPEVTSNQSDMASNQPNVPSIEQNIVSNKPNIASNQSNIVSGQPNMVLEIATNPTPDMPASHSDCPQVINNESNLITYEFNIESNSLDSDYDMDNNNYDEQPFMPGNHLDIVIEEVKVPMYTIKEEVEVKVEKADSVKSEVDVKNDDSSDEDYFPVNTWASTPKVELNPSTPAPAPRKKRSKTTGPLKCNECDKIINSVSYMKVHLRTHTGERPFKCYICDRAFITSSKMHRHVLTHNESWTVDTKVKKEEAAEEEDNDEDKKNSKSLKEAKAKFAKKKKGEKIIKKHQKRPHSCEFCHKKFLHVETLNVHKKSHVGEKISRSCDFCLLPMEDDEQLKAHEATHTGPKPYICTICGKCYKRKETMLYHKKHHKAEKTFVCDICSKSFDAQCKLQRHIASHKVEKFILRYECPVCAHMFNTKYHIQMHLTTHQKEGLISEDNRNDILAMVLQNARKIPKSNDVAPLTMADMIPAEERSRVCNICGEVFQHFYYLEEHLKTHGSKIAIEDLDKAEEKKYTCQVCSKSFKLHYYLKLHTFTHTKEKPYICQQCGKGFITKGKLKRHLETHTGLKKYQCHICYKFFTRPSYLRIHVRTIHGTQNYNFKIIKEYGMSPLNALSVLSDHSV